MTAITHSWFMMLRYLRALIRQPWYIAFTLLQPIIWLLLYGQLFQKVVELPGFHAISYIDFLTPGVVIMTALFSSGWTGMGLIREIDRGTLDRFLVSPLNRSALIAGRLCQVAFITIVQSAILLVLGLLLGARYAGGPGLRPMLIEIVVHAVAAFRCLDEGEGDAARPRRVPVDRGLVFRHVGAVDGVAPGRAAVPLVRVGILETRMADGDRRRARSGRHRQRSGHAAGSARACTRARRPG